MLTTKANKKLIQQHIFATSGKRVTLKDIHNMVERQNGEIADLVEEMRKIPGEWKIFVQTPEPDIVLRHFRCCFRLLF
jgi:hypothetical protein